MKRARPPPHTHTSPSSSPEFDVASWWAHLVLTCLATKSKSKKRVTHFRLVRPNYTHTHTYGIYLTHTHTHCQADILVQTYTQHSQAADRIFIINKCWWLEKCDYSKANIFVHLITVCVLCVCVYVCLMCVSVSQDCSAKTQNTNVSTSWVHTPKDSVAQPDVVAFHICLYCLTVVAFWYPAHTEEMCEKGMLNLCKHKDYIKIFLS